jgi:hypothetical protein
MSKLGNEKPKEYSDEFDKLRQNRVELSFFKYGSAADNFGEGLVNALATHDMCIRKYLATGNTEYLTDAANYLMFEFMYPSVTGAYFKATDSSGSAGVIGTPVKELGKDKTFDNIVFGRDISQHDNK